MPDLERIQQSTPGTLSQQWYEDGAAVDPGTVTVGITRADGTVLVAGGTATSGTGTAARTYNLTTTHTALLDRLTVTWTSTLKGTLVSYVEVVGGFLFSIPKAKALQGLSSFTATDLASARTMVEMEFEKAANQAFVPRYERETILGDGSNVLRTEWPYIRALRSLTINGIDCTSSLPYIAVNPYGILTHTAGTFSNGLSNLVVVGYEHGQSSTPGAIERVALIVLRSWLGGMNRPIDDRAITFNVAEGGTYSLAVAGRNGSEFGHPDVDSVLARHNMRVGLA